MNENPGLLHTMHDVARFHQIEGAFSKYKICIAAAHPNKIYENNNKTELKLGSITTASCFVGWQGKTIFTHEGLDFTTKKIFFGADFEISTPKTLQKQRNIAAYQGNKSIQMNNINGNEYAGSAKEWNPKQAPNAS